MGAGPGSHGRITRDGVRDATIAHNHPKTYIEAVDETGCGIAETEKLSAADWASEYLLMGLRINDGIPLRRYQEISGNALNIDAIRSLESDGFVARKNNRLFASLSGRE